MQEHLYSTITTEAFGVTFDDQQGLLRNSHMNVPTLP